MMPTIRRLFLAVCLIAPSTVAIAKSLTVNGLRTWSEGDKMRLVFDLSGPPVNNDVLMLQNPPRLVVNIEQAKLQKKINSIAPNEFISDIFSVEDDGVKVVVELKKNLNFSSFNLASKASKGHRFVIDLREPGSKSSNRLGVDSIIPQPQVIRTSSSDRSNAMQAGESIKSNANVIKVEHAPKSQNEISTRAPEKKTESGNAAELKRGSNSSEKTVFGKASSRSNNLNGSKNLVIAIDAGHGGEDSGAIGPHGTEEKEVVFKIAKKLAALVERQPGMKAVMVREGDNFIKLRNRMTIARNARADMFVSIHADAFTNANARGASVFTLSRKGASSEAARWLADNENAADLVGGVSLDDKDDMLASVLLDLSQTATTEASANIAQKVLTNVRAVNPLHKNAVQKAGFMVLKSPDIPSILVETAFISNPEEEARLNTDGHQLKIAKAIFNGIVAHFKHNNYAPVQLRTASKDNVGMMPRSDTRVHLHNVANGETLSDIAQHYGVRVKDIKSVNAMTTGMVREGQKIRIPVES